MDTTNSEWEGKIVSNRLDTAGLLLLASMKPLREAGFGCPAGGRTPGDYHLVVKTACLLPGIRGVHAFAVGRDDGMLLPSCSLGVFLNACVYGEFPLQGRP